MTRAESRKLVAQLNRDAARIARRFGLRYRSIEAERANVKRRYGICYSDGTIKIRLRHVVTGEPLRYSSLVNTLCHELAHLRHFNHGPRFKAFYLQLLEWSRAEGIYRPRRAAAAVAPIASRPVQADWRSAWSAARRQAPPPASPPARAPRAEAPPTRSPAARAPRADAPGRRSGPRATQLELF